VSPDFGCHPVGYLVICILEQLCRDADVICYNDRYQRDRLTSRFQAAAATWRDVVSLNDEELADQIRADRIDVLFDLAGHTARNRLLVFARKPAPIQVTWISSVGTTGLAAIDYVLADHHVLPTGAEPFIGEEILRMPDAYVCYDPIDAAPPVDALPAARNRFISFGSYNNLAKITPQVIEVWSEILRRMPHSRLVLRYHGLNDETVCDRYRNLIAANDVDPRRAMFLPPACAIDVVSSYREIDIALDPFPFSGGVTTCEALWMGVPVLTWPGQTFASRQSLSILSAVGLTESIACDRSHYVELAVGLASDLERLASMRATLRERMARSPLCDGQRFAGHLLQLLRGVWKQWMLVNC
jgi:predicted O-linked N-acetylglucosamine transferase (SPINDLY family)